MENKVLDFDNLINNFNNVLFESKKYVHDNREGEKFLNYNVVDYSYEDYTSKNVRDILDLDILQDDAWIDYYIMNDGDVIEGVSYRLYDTTIYWDVLILINERDPLFGLPYSYDTLVDVATAKINDYNMQYKGNIESSNPIYYQELIDAELEKLIEQNDLNRTIKIIRPSKINEFLKILKENNI